MDKPVILYDNSCNLCQGSVDFLSKADRDNRLQYISCQSDKGAILLEEYNLKNIDSVVLIDHGKVYLKSDAIIRSFRKIRSLSWLGQIMLIFPKTFRDSIYRFISRNRHKIFGKKNQY